jgi:hypothetical protein
VKHAELDMNEDTLVFETPVCFETQLVKLDTKQFGLPQTRQRGYLFVWQPELVGTRVGHLWQELVRYLESPVQHSLDTFLLPSDDDRVRTVREMLRGPIGKMTRTEQVR